MSAAYRKRLWNLIKNEPYASMSDSACLIAVNAKTDTRIVKTRIHERDILTMFSTLSAGEAFLGKLDTGAANNAVLKRALHWFLPSEQGIDVGHIKTRAMLDALVGLFGITQSEVNVLKNYAVENVSPLQSLNMIVARLGDIVTTRQLYS